MRFFYICVLTYPDFWVQHSWVGDSDAPPWRRGIFCCSLNTKLDRSRRANKNISKVYKHYCLLNMQSFFFLLTPHIDDPFSKKYRQRCYCQRDNKHLPHFQSMSGSFSFYRNVSRRDWCCVHCCWRNVNSSVLTFPPLLYYLGFSEFPRFFFFIKDRSTLKIFLSSLFINFVYNCMRYARTGRTVFPRVLAFWRNPTLNIFSLSLHLMWARTHSFKLLAYFLLLNTNGMQHDTE